MSETIVRLSTLKIANIKNVEDGKIIMPNTLRKQENVCNAEVLGIYGQNGSGKTAIIDTLFFLQKIMIGESLPNELYDYVGATESQAEIFAEFSIFLEDITYEVGYQILIEKDEHTVRMKREILTYVKKQADSKTSKSVLMDYQSDDKETVFRPKKRVDDIVSSNKENKTDLIVARKMAERSNCSYIFGESSREIFCRSYESNFQDGAIIIKALYMYARKDLFVIRNTHSGVISANFLLPVAFRVEDKDFRMKGDFTVPMLEPIVLSEEKKEILDRIMEQINTVLYTIIPGMHIGLKDYGKQMTERGEIGHKVELISMRQNKPPIPIRMESEGIIKMISILNVWIHAFGSPSVCLAVDELDAGVFEYMLGELLEIFSHSAKGQLIFTSHNLRPLEMLHKDCIMFSTANPKKRYIHINSMKSSKNLRDVYLRGITLGGHEEVIYEETDSLKMARAFRKAGRGIRHE